MEDLSAPTFLIVLDGAGWGLEGENNAIRQSKLFDLQKQWIGQCFTCLLNASDTDIGLPERQVGGSEVGHVVTGAGAPDSKYASVSAYSNAIRDPAYYESDQWKDIMQRLQKTGGTAHLQTILSDGGIHSLQDNLYPQIEALAKAGIPVELHLALDGRDTPQGSALMYLEQLQTKIKDIQEQYPNAAINIATLAGRAIAHDRDKKWEKTEAAVSAMINPANSGFTDPKAYLEEYFNNNPSEETLPPIARNGFPGYDHKKDSMDFCNFRPDRMLQLVKIFLKMTGADPQTLLTAVKYTEDNFGVPFVVEVPPVLVPLPRLMDWVARAQGKSIFALAHSEKYSHVTTFLNGGRAIIFPAQVAQVFKSPDGQENYAQHPLMRADDVTDAAIQAANNGAFFVAVNYANPDMVGHTGDFNATVQACNHVAQQVQRLIQEVQKDHPNATFVITADHGNADDMSNGAHSMAPVLCVVIEGQEPLRTSQEAEAYAAERIQRYDAVVADGKIDPKVVGNLGDVAIILLTAAGLPIPRRIEDLDQYKTLINQIIDERKEAALSRREARNRVPSFVGAFGEGAHLLEEEAEKTLEQLDNLCTTLIQEISDVQQQLRDRGDTTIMTGSDMQLPLNERHPLKERRHQRLQETPEYEYLTWAREVAGSQRG